MGSFTDLFIRRPVLATVVSLLILLAGLPALFYLQIRQYPVLSQTPILPPTRYPGSTPYPTQGLRPLPSQPGVATSEGP